MNDINGKYVANGLVLNVEVSPCSWMYPGYGFQIGYTSEDKHSRGFVLDKSIDVNKATKEDVQKLCDSLEIKLCEKCNNKYLHDPTGSGGDLCRICNCEKLEQDFKKDQEKERRRLRRKDLSMKKKGFTHRVTAWVHPIRGDDYQIDIYYNVNPTSPMIHEELIKNKSRVLNDYQVFELK